MQRKVGSHWVAGCLSPPLQAWQRMLGPDTDGGQRWCRESKTLTGKDKILPALPSWCFFGEKWTTKVNEFRLFFGLNLANICFRCTCLWYPHIFPNWHPFLFHPISSALTLKGLCILFKTTFPFYTSTIKNTPLWSGVAYRGPLDFLIRFPHIMLGSDPFQIRCVRKPGWLPANGFAFLQCFSKGVRYFWIENW